MGKSPTPDKTVLEELDAAIQAAGGDEVVFDRIANGDKQGRILNIANDFGCSRRTLYRWLEVRKERFEEAKRIAASNMIEENGELLDNAASLKDGITTQEVQLLRERLGHNKYIASIWDRDTFGEQKAGITLNIGSLHLDALRAAGQMVLQATEVKALPAEIIEDDT